MAVPRNRHSNARKNTRRAHDALKARSSTTCESCSAPKVPHRVCAKCGTYRGRTVLAKAEAAE